MVRCWTCSTKNEITTGDEYVCDSCDKIADQIVSLQKIERDKISRIDDLIYLQKNGFDSMAGGMSEIASAIEWGFTELNWELQQQTRVLKEITAILKMPSETKANEWRQMGEELRRRGGYGEAVKFFSKSMKANPLDYRTYVGLGETHLRMRMFSDAKKYFERSLPHAPNNFFKSYSLRLIGRIYYCREDYRNAVQSLKEAVELSPNYTEALYDLAQYHAVRGDAKNSLPLLRTVIKQNSFYFYLSEREKNFNSIRREITQQLEEIKEDAHKDVQDIISSAKDALKDSEKSFNQLQVKKENKKIWNHLELATEKVSSKDYKSILEAKPIARKVFDSAQAAKDRVPQVIKLQKVRYNRYKLLSFSTVLHLLFLVCFMLTFVVIWWIYLIGAFLEGMAFSSWDWEDADDSVDMPVGAFFKGLIYAPLTFFSILSYFESSKWIEKDYEDSINSIRVFDEQF